MKISWQTPEVTVFESSLYRTTSTVIDFHQQSNDISYCNRYNN